MKKIIIILLVCVAVTGTLFVVIRENKSNSDNITINQEKDMKEYTNKNFGFSFKYPTNTKIKDSEINVILSLRDLIQNNNIESSFPFIVNISSIEIGKEQSIKTWWENNGPQNGRQAPYPDEQKIIQVAGQDAYYTRYDSEANAFGYNKLSAVFIYVAHNGKVYEISGGALPPNPEQSGLTETEITTIKQYEQVFQKILESFTFID